MPTTNPVPSTDPGDLLYNAQKLDEVVTGTADSYTDRLGVSRLTLTGAMRLLGYEAPVAFASGLNITRASQTVTNGGNTYHANPASLPFTTTATFNASQWRVINNITYADMTGYAIPKAGATDLAASFKTTGTWSGSRFEVDASFAAYLSGGVAYIQFDDGDAFTFNRATNTLDINIGGSRMTVSSTAGPERASDASTANGLVRKSQMETAIDGAGFGRLIRVLVFTNSGTYTPAAGMKQCLVRMAGGGGSGGGGSVGSNTGLGGGGGGAGATAVALFTAAEIGAAREVTIGAGGASSTGGPGNSGGTTSFGSLLSCTGGAGGSHTVSGSVIQTALGGDGGSPSGSFLFASSGGAGGGAWAGYNAGSFLTGFGGTGGGNEFGGGGRAGNSAAEGPGLAGGGYGCGGGGAGVVAGTAESGAGRQGIVIVYEYA